MIDLRFCPRGGLRLTMLALLGMMNAGCPAGSDSTGSGAGGGNTQTGGGGSGAGGSLSGGGSGTGGAICQPEQEICDGADNDCNGAVDDVPDLPQGCTCIKGQTQSCYSGAAGTAGVGACKPGTQACAGGTWGECTNQVKPVKETCNLQDDDCNGTVDDVGVLSCGIGECANAVPACVDGVPQTCAPGQPGVEVCDGKDNNCNQAIDESDPALGSNCLTGMPGVCTLGKNECIGAALTCVTSIAPSTEICDGLDNDCNGVVDDNLPGTGAACAGGGLGVCEPAAISCGLANGSYEIGCFPLVPASPELCDGLDNNCDGQVDDNDPEGGLDCDTGELGVCGVGVLHCVDAVVQCIGQFAAYPEDCNGLDDNCDGQIDEGDPGAGQFCYTGLAGICETGITSCANGSLACNQDSLPTVESCNDLDDDCNGQVDDGNPGGGAACTTGLPGVCDAGTMTCQGGQVSCLQDVQPSAEVCGNALDENCDGAVGPQAVTVYFNETFADNSAGWTLGNSWAIGPTVMSAPTGSCGLGDPALDQSPTADNGVAGTVLGGNISQAVAGPFYLTSPVVDTSAVPTLYLEYWRWLHSDYPNYMIDTVEVYDGSSWVGVWQNPSGQVVNDVAWTKMSHEITAYKNAQMQVRFSIRVGSGGAYLCAGWNVDDVQLVDAQCN
jgi:hypothetical protein